jgi:hypothetical protein
MALDVVPEQRIGELELEPATAVTADTDGEAPADKAAPADETAVEAGEPQPDDDLTQAEAFDELSAFAAAAATPTAAPEPKPARPTLPPPPPPPEPAPAKPAVMPPMSMRSASWEGTAVFEVGQQTALVRPPSQPGMGVVASVISGPSGTRVGSVQLNDDGLAVISLSEPARGPVAVAWFAVPAVDENLRPGRP